MGKIAGWPAKTLLKGREVKKSMSRLLTVLYAFPPSVLRDISERGRDLEQILSQYITFVKPAFEEFCLPVSTGSSTHRKASFPGQVVRQERFTCQSPLPAGAGKKNKNKIK